MKTIVPLALSLAAGVLATTPLVVQQDPLQASAEIAARLDALPVPSSTFESATVQILNSFPVPATFIIRHSRGVRNEGYDEEKRFKTLSRGETSEYMGVAYETLRKDWDVWSVGMHFGNSSWTLWTRAQEVNFGIDDAHSNSVFEAKDSYIDIKLPRLSATVQFDQAGAGFPARNFNGFIFLAVSGLDEKASVKIELDNEYGEESAYQSHVYESEGAYMHPFYIQNSGRYQENEDWTFTLDSPRLGKLKANTTCHVDTDYLGWPIILQLSDKGYVFGYNIKRERSCRGSWN